MPKQRPKINVVSYIHVGNKLINTDDLNDEQRKYVAIRLKQQYMNALFQGRAIFGLPDNTHTTEDVFSELRKKE